MADRNFLTDLDCIMAIEGEDLDTEDTAAAFQHLIDDGVVWQLQGFYGRTAHSLIQQGLCHSAARGE